MTRTRKLAGGLIVVALFGACRGNEQPGPDGAKPASAAPVSNELPPISVKADTANLLLTWIDEKGDFHVVQKPEDVPATSRAEVRVVLTDREEGTGKLVYVADLGSTTPDGSYRIKTMTRAVGRARCVTTQGAARGARTERGARAIGLAGSYRARQAGAAVDAAHGDHLRRVLVQTVP